MKATLVKLGVFVVFSAGCMGWLFLRIGEFGGSAGAFRPTYKLTESVTDATGLVVMASNDVTKRYWHADVALQ